MDGKKYLSILAGVALIFVGGNSWAAITSCLSGATDPGQAVCLGNDPYDPVLSQDTEANVLTVINDNLLVGESPLTSLVSLGKNEEGIGGVGTIESTDGGFSGTWSFSEPVAFVSVKADGSFKVFDVMGVDDGTWDTFGLINHGGNQAAWSHVSFWQTDPQTVVPLPAAAWLFISGLGALGMLRRQQAA